MYWIFIHYEDSFKLPIVAMVVAMNASIAEITTCLNHSLCIVWLSELLCYLYYFM